MVSECRPEANSGSCFAPPGEAYDAAGPLSLLDDLRMYLNVGNHVLILLVTVAMSWRCIQMKLEKTAMHAYLCTLGFVFLLAEGTMVRYNANILTHSMDEAAKTKCHFWLQLIGGVLGCAGTAQKSIQKKQHFKSWHGKFGIAACLFFVANLCIGLLGVSSTHYARLMASHWHRFVHTLIGIVTFLTAMIAQYLGYNTGFMRRNFVNIPKYKFCTVVIIILTVVGPLQMLLWRFVRLF